MDQLLAFINALPPEQRIAFASACGTTINYLRKACSKKQQLGADLCIAIERESSGAVTCEQIRPDADWAYLRATAKPLHKTAVA